MSYNRCACQKCGNQYATVIDKDEELQNEPCPNCGEKQLKIIAPMTVSEVNGLFSGGVEAREGAETGQVSKGLK